MHRTELDVLVAHYRLNRENTKSVLAMAQAQPGGQALSRFLARLLQLAGVLSLAAGLIFMVAANWQDLQVFGRFALVEAILFASIVLALVKQPPHRIGQFALLISFVASGALLALFGQTYQTGADIYELFLSWTVLTLPFALAAQWSVVWAGWLLVLNLALWLFCGLQPASGWLWMAFGGWDMSTPVLLLIPTLLNTGLWFATGTTRLAPLTPSWLRRLIVAFAVATLTWAGQVAIFERLDDWGAPITLLAAVINLAGIAARALQRRDDVFPLAAVAGSVIALTSAALARALEHGDESSIFFLLGAWLIVSSTVCGRVLMKWVRDWRVTGAA